MSAIDRLAPQNREAEEAVLGSLFVQPEEITQVSYFLEPRDFSKVANGWIYEAMLSMSKRDIPIDILTMVDELKRLNKLEEVGAEEYLIGLVSAMPTSINLVHYAKIVKDASQRRRLINACGMIANVAYNEGEDLEQALTLINKAALMLANNGKSTGDYLHEVGRKVLDQIEAVIKGERSPGMLLGLDALDQILQGINRGDFIVIAGRPGMGKTALMLKLLNKLQKRKCVFITLEMSSDDLVLRWYSMVTGVPIKAIKRGEALEQMELLYRCQDDMRQSKIILYDDATIAQSIDKMIAMLKYYSTQLGGLDFVFIDYLQLIGSGKETNRTQELSGITRKLKLAARELDCVMVVGSQLSRAVESRQDKRPMLSDLRESGTIEQDTDIVIFLYRDEYYNPGTTDRPGIAEANVAKHRNGATGTADLAWVAESATFTDIRPKRAGETWEEH
jgi:replicative DNA helicase